ncbi:histone deacetylase complex subunit SAP30/SAP30-like protein, partial [Tanacetum coccineum]
VTQEAKEKAAEAKSRADAVLKHKEYSMALDAYTQTDARTCWELKPNWVKAWYREGLSLCLLQKVNFSKLGTNTLWRYYSNFNLGNIHSSPTKEQLVNAVQKHFESQKVSEMEAIMKFINEAKSRNLEEAKGIEADRLS